VASHGPDEGLLLGIIDVDVAVITGREEHMGVYRGEYHGPHRHVVPLKVVEELHADCVVHSDGAVHGPTGQELSIRAPGN